jgi:hypothetical protein
MTAEPHRADAAGTAALGICESLLLALTELSVLSARDARHLLTDVAVAQHAAACVSQTPEAHREVIELVQRILADDNGTRLRLGLLSH